MEIIKPPIEGLLVIKPKIFEDHRGHFFEIWSNESFAEQGLDLDFVQDNQSLSNKGVLRGLHFQNPPFAQGKLVRVINGSVLDVVVDIRKGSPTYGKHISVELSGENKRQLFIPRGFAHGFSVLSNNAVFAYKVDNNYVPESDSGIRYDDHDLNIDWGLNEEEVQLSAKDKNLNSFKDLDSPFNF